MKLPPLNSSTTALQIATLTQGADSLADIVSPDFFYHQPAEFFNMGRT